MWYTYSATQNSDLTEGRGTMVPFAYFTNEADAVKAVKGRGVMGVGDGEVYKISVYESFDEWDADARDGSRRRDVFVSERVYGYRKNWKGLWDYGYLDNRDAPVNDPEYKEYVRLAKKFGAKL